MSKRKRALEDQGSQGIRKLKKPKNQEPLKTALAEETAETSPVKAKKRKDTDDAGSPKVIEQATGAEQLSKRERKLQRKKQQAALQLQVQNHETKKEKDVDRKGRKRRKKKETELQDGPALSETHRWKVSDPVGGHLLDLDPIFSPDEEFLILAYESAIVIFSTATSLPIRHLRITRGDRISAFALSSAKAHDLYLSTISGIIERWDWLKGVQIGHWKLSSSIHHLKTSARTTEEAVHDIVYTVDRKDTGPWLISAYHLNSAGDSSNREGKTLFSHPRALSHIQVLEGGQFIIAASGSQLIIGNTSSPKETAIPSVSYTWRIVDCPEWIVSIDVRVFRPEIVSKQSKGGKRKIQSLDISVGGLKGSIHIYENLLQTLVQIEQPTNKKGLEDIKARRLHWHRNAVLSLKWSRDGNYLISGGEETVLVLWQLETSRKQTLPHLGAPIESVVVSPSGSSYAVRLADNSAMILSTTELRPTFSVAGIQIPSELKDEGADVPFLPTVDTPFQGIKPKQRPNLPVCTSSSHPSSLLLAVPPSISSKLNRKTPQSASYLQMFDFSVGFQVSRQALTRTNITNVNIGPESNTIEEPNVIHMQISMDGSWLATVDEWTPPRRDLAFLAFDEDRMAEEQNFHKEIHLKFWFWNDESKVWELVSRIDNPHKPNSSADFDEGGVYALASDRSSVGFATIGSDDTIRIWRPAVRRRHGLDVRNKQGRSLTSWYRKHLVYLDSTERVPRTNPQGAKLVYSHDGSILVGALQSSATSAIFIVDTDLGELREMQTGLYSGSLLGLEILDQYLITLSKELLVIDLVKDELSYGINLITNGLSLAKQLQMSHLTVDSRQGTFAVALPEIKFITKKNLTELRSLLAVFDPTNATPLFQTAFRNPITALLPLTDRKGFVAVDSAAEVRTIAPSQSSQILASTGSENKRELPRRLDDIFKNDGESRALENGTGGQNGTLELKSSNVINGSHTGENDTVVVNQDQLAEVFSCGLAHTLPPVTQLFEQVASLYSGRGAS
ncbi:NET1-associated nuclear protein 1 [Lecanora helva]